jgi:hypothetical protein
MLCCAAIVRARIIRRTCVVDYHHYKVHITPQKVFFATHTATIIEFALIKGLE